MNESNKSFGRGLGRAQLPSVYSYRYGTSTTTTRDTTTPGSSGPRSVRRSIVRTCMSGTTTVQYRNSKWYVCTRYNLGTVLPLAGFHVVGRAEYGTTGGKLLLYCTSSQSYSYSYLLITNRPPLFFRPQQIPLPRTT